MPNARRFVGDTQAETKQAAGEILGNQGGGERIVHGVTAGSATRTPPRPATTRTPERHRALSPVRAARPTGPGARHRRHGHEGPRPLRTA